MSTSLLGGACSEKFGGRQTIGVAMIFSVIFTALVPPIAPMGMWYVWTLRVLVGAASGPMYPAFHNLVSKWAPPDEKGKFVATLMGGIFGTAVTFPMMGAICESLGWKWAFYIPALITVFLTIIWYYLVADKPAVHPRISKKELDYIQTSLGDAVSKEKVYQSTKTVNNIIMAFVIFSDSYTLFNDSDIDSFPRPDASPLWKLVGSVLPDNGSSYVHK